MIAFRLPGYKIQAPHAVDHFDAFGGRRERCLGALLLLGRLKGIVVGRKFSKDRKRFREYIKHDPMLMPMAAGYGGSGPRRGM